MITKFLKTILPSWRTYKDPLQVVREDGENCLYSPIPLGELKLTPWMRYLIYKSRHQPAVVATPRYDKRLAILIPYRHREQHLKQAPSKLHEFLASENIAHEIFVIEQADDKPFNKGKLLNIGFSLLKDNFDYFCFHDIDMVPITASYAYINHPLLLANSASQFDEHANHPTYFGGVVLFRKEDFITINGFSNNYWHWGYEDDDMHMRCLIRGLTPVAYTEGRYTSLPHEKSVTQTTDGAYQTDPKIIAHLNKLYMRNKKYYKKVRRGIIDISKDGLRTVDYELVGEERTALYTKFSVQL